MASINSKPCVLVVGGNDSAGLAGLAQDIRTNNALGAHPLPTVTANTAQNNQLVLAVNPVDSQTMQSQLEAVRCFGAKVIKSGMLANQQQVNALAATIEAHQLVLVMDPVVKASSGEELRSGMSDQQTQRQMLQPLLQQAAVVTPNIAEAELISQLTIQTPRDVELATKTILELGAKAAVIKGGHLANKNWSQDYFTDGERSFWLTSPRIDNANTRGTGCAFASAIAAALAQDYPIYDAVVIAKMALNQGIRQALPVNQQQGCVNVTRFPKQQQDLPYLTQSADFDFDEYQFLECAEELPLGLYPVVDRAHWLERLLPLGISTIQLRVKDLEGEALAQEIEQAVQIARRFNARLFINDYWQLAIEKGAYGVHLGQEDLDEADLKAIQQAGLRLGTSTHCHYEVARAHAYRPSYIACGPVFPTTTKIMPWIPHGVEGLSYWLDTLEYPMVAIGGINAERVTPIANTGVSGVAMITAITLADDPETTATRFKQQIEQAYETRSN